MTMKKTRAELNREIRKQQNKEILLDALRKSNGLVSIACINANVSRTTYYNYLMDDDFREAVEDINESNLDKVEHALFKKIQEGDIRAIMFYLRFKGKSRGYYAPIEDNNTVEVIKLVEESGKRSSDGTITYKNNNNNDEEEDA